ncbi:hypothetical protein RF11_00930 [Thelohanellus kitauei]|uniref:MULE transposase domain-containing protein n=1 Tax=Thelohanellus kitauei TaxID=669202 RepID=A0A0C2J917_THEKT|nr:hypothetical protein RF11_00930 [Thelohanellus kitauei]
MDIYSIKKRHGLGLLIDVVLSIKARIVCVDKEHRHGPDPNKVNSRRVLNQVKKNARTFQLSTPQIVASNVIGINQSTASALPALTSMIVLFNGRLYTVHCKINNTVIPTVYGLLPTKSESIYTSFFTAISNLKPGLSPATIMLDFEISSHNALRRVFPQTILKGCFYRLSQSFWRKIQMNEPTLSRYREEWDFVITAKMILAICFVPIPDICFAFEKLLSMTISKISILA